MLLWSLLAETAFPMLKDGFEKRFAVLCALAAAENPCAFPRFTGRGIENGSPSQEIQLKSAPLLQARKLQCGRSACSYIVVSTS